MLKTYTLTISLTKTSLNGCNISFLYPPFSKYPILFSIIHAFLSIPSVVLLGVFNDYSRTIVLLFFDKDASINSAKSKSLSKKLTS